MVAWLSLLASVSVGHDCVEESSSSVLSIDIACCVLAWVGEVGLWSVGATSGRTVVWKGSCVCVATLEVKGRPDGPQLAKIFWTVPVQRAPVDTTCRNSEDLHVCNTATGT